MEAISDMLGATGVEVDITQYGNAENLAVKGIPNLCAGGLLSVGQDPHNIVIDSYNDHRIAMAAAAIAAATDVPVVIKDAMAVDKSYPGFYDVIKKVGIGSEPV